MDYSITNAAAQVLDFLNPLVTWFSNYQLTNLSLLLLAVITIFCFLLGGVVGWFFITNPFEGKVDTSDDRDNTFANRQIDIKTKAILEKNKS